MVGESGFGFGISVLGVIVRQTAGSHVLGGSGSDCSWPRDGGLVLVVNLSRHGTGSKLEGMNEMSRDVAARCLVCEDRGIRCRESRSGTGRVNWDRGDSLI